VEQLIDAMEEGDQIVLFTIGENTFSNWDDQLKDKLAEVGVDQAVVEGLIDGQPVIFFGTKGATPGSARAITRNATGFPIREQFLTFNGQATGRFTSGSLITQPIGPANKWWRFDYSLDTEPSDNVSIRVIGITPTGQEVVQFTEGRVDEIDISTIDAAQYPSLRLEADFSDEYGLTPPQVNYWRLYYETPPDGMVLQPNSESQILQEGDSIQTSVSFYNYSNTDFQDTVSMTATFRDVEGGTEFVASERVAGPAAGDTISFAIKEPTIGRVGEFDLGIRLDPEEPEIYQVNNAANLSRFARVEPDRVNPILDITFDGAYILNGDLVSPTPLINVLLKDQNQVLMKSDTTGISVFLRSGDEGSFVRVPFTSPEMTYTPATEPGEDFTIQYEPGPLEDNRYALRVEATDGSGNSSGAQPYEITFEVVNESSITRFFPYPNPFSTSTRFVFTLTGAMVPDEIKIQILTVSGRVVREILQDEIGPIRIGNNMTQYAWDGTDEFGDRLANGVYLYRTVVKMPNGFTERNEGINQYFKNGWGKMYLMR